MKNSHQRVGQKYCLSVYHYVGFAYNNIGPGMMPRKRFKSQEKNNEIIFGCACNFK